MDLRKYSFGFLFLLIQFFNLTNSNLMNEKMLQKNFNDNIVLRDSSSSSSSSAGSGSSTSNNNVITQNDSKSILKIPPSPNSNVILSEELVDSDEQMTMTLSDQVRLLSKQLNALTLRRREDYKLLENSLKNSLIKKTTNINNKNIDMDIRNEMDQLWHEIKSIRDGGNSNKERLTVEWLTQSIAEMRKELSELQEIANSAIKDINQHRQTFEDLTTIKSDFKTIKLELEALKYRQEKTEVFVRELQEETVQKEEDFRRVFQINDKTKSTIDYIEPEADHRRRHQRFVRQQIHDLELSQRNFKEQLSQLNYNHYDERIRKLEFEQKHLNGVNFNLTREIVGLDKLHGSMLELLEDVESIQNKYDKNIPDIKREISKLEFTSAQLNSEQSLIREECHNIAKSIQAMAVSVSTLQDERDNVKIMKNTMENLQENVEQLQSANDIHKSIVQQRIEKMEIDAQPNNNTTKISSNQYEMKSVETANNLIQQLESVELQYESIINKLPIDCSQIQQQTTNGLYLIAPIGQHRPIMSYCLNGWTTIQRRFDGSVDFNRSWESYAQGFGSPSGEFWIGNENLHHLTYDNCTQLKIIMQDIYDNTWLAIYNNFYISSRDDGYRLYVQNYNGNASDALDYQNHMQFSAIDVDRDISNTHCAANYEGGWWFSHCQHANLNGRYNLGLTWFDATRNEWIAVKSSQMMITKRSECILKNLTTDSTTTTITSVV